MKRFSVVALCVLVACATYEVRLDHQAPPTRPMEPPGSETATVTRVVDGDTVEVTIESYVPGPGAGQTSVGESYDVRLIGIDTPESVKPGTPVECFAREASAATKVLLEGRSVAMVKDVENADRYGRLLRYIYIGDEMANARLVTNGYAYAYTYPPNVRHSGLFVQLQQEARENSRGLWSPDSCGGEP